MSFVKERNHYTKVCAGVLKNPIGIIAGQSVWNSPGVRAGMGDARRIAFDDNVIGRIGDSDPLFWCVAMGNVAEEVPHLNMTALSANRGEHMRLIIGYNEDRGEVLYSDSWGEGHELKRMDGLDALSITTGMYYLTDKPQQ